MTDESRVIDNLPVLIGIDASRCIADRLTGTERYSREVIAAMLRVAPQHRYRLYFREGNAAQRAAYLAALPSHAIIEPVVVHASRLWTHIGLRRELIARPPDALFVPAHVLPIGLPRSLRTVVTVHDVGYRRFPQAHPLRQRLYLDWGTRHSVRAASVVIADSQATAQDIARFYSIDLTDEAARHRAQSPQASGVEALAGSLRSGPFWNRLKPRLHIAPAASKIRVAHPGALPLADVTEAQVDAALSQFGIARGQPFALHVGTLQPRKNLRRLIEAWARTRKPDGALLVLAGGAGWGGENLVSDVNNSVRLLGYVSDEDKAALMRCARAYVFPSLYEGFGFPVLEAQSVGVPVTCSNTSSLAEVAGGSAALFDPLNIDDMAHAIGRVMCDEVLRSQLIDAGHRNAVRFSWDACARVVVSALESSSHPQMRTALAWGSEA